MTGNCDRESQHDAELVVKKTRHDSLIAWKWSDGRKTLTPTEHEEMTTLIKEAETRCDPREYDSGDVIARVWMNNDETIRNVRWADDA
jgi:hypothetical protein